MKKILFSFLFISLFSLQNIYALSFGGYELNFSKWFGITENKNIQETSYQVTTGNIQIPEPSTYDVNKEIIDQYYYNLDNTKNIQLDTANTETAEIQTINTNTTESDMTWIDKIFASIFGNKTPIKKDTVETLNANTEAPKTTGSGQSGTTPANAVSNFGNSSSGGAGSQSAGLNQGSNPLSNFGNGNSNPLGSLQQAAYGTTAPGAPAIQEATKIDANSIQGSIGVGGDGKGNGFGKGNTTSYGHNRNGSNDGEDNGQTACGGNSRVNGNQKRAVSLQIPIIIKIFGTYNKSVWCNTPVEVIYPKKQTCITAPLNEAGPSPYTGNIMDLTGTLWNELDPGGNPGFQKAIMQFRVLKKGEVGCQQSTKTS